MLGGVTVALVLLGVVGAAPIAGPVQPDPAASRPSASQGAGRITLRFLYPDSQLSRGKKLFVRGDSLGLTWSSGLELSHMSTDTWATTLIFDAALAGNRVEFKALVDDTTWQIGSNNAIVLPSDGTATATVTAYPWFFTNQGSYHYLRNVHSPQLHNTRDLVFYVPPSFFENTYKTYPALVMHDGQNLFNESTSFAGVAWRCQDTVD
jgi:hypothetical protein